MKLEIIMKPSQRTRNPDLLLYKKNIYVYFCLAINILYTRKRGNQKLLIEGWKMQWPKKGDKRTNNDLQNTIQKT